MYSENDLLGILEGYFKQTGKMPTQQELRSMRISEDPFYRVFGSFSKAKDKCLSRLDARKAPLPEKATTLCIPDGHVGPDQDLSRFSALSNLILERKPSRVILMGDFVTLESLSNWDLSKSGVMEGRRYQADIEAGKNALGYLLNPIIETTGYQPEIAFIKGNHEQRLDRYLDTKPELKEHLDLATDLGLDDFGVTKVVEYRDSVEYDGVLFTHAPMNAANQAVSGKFAIHRAAEQTHKSLVFGHTHRKESVNYFRHGADNIIQVATVGAFFEHTDAYAYGGLNAYWRGVVMLTHWSEGRFDMEDISLERLMEEY